MKPGLWMIVLAAGCGTETPPHETTLGGLKVQIYESPAKLVIRDAAGDVVFEGLGGGDVAAGAEPLVAFAARHSDATVDTGFGTFRVQDHDPGPWTGASRFVDVTTYTGGDVTFRMLDAHGSEVGTAQIHATDGGVAIDLQASAADANRASFGFACADVEHFLGMGGQSWDVDHRGQNVPLWVQEDGIGKDDTDDYVGTWYVKGRRHQTHTPIPIYLSSRGYALVLDTPYRSIFDFCSTDPHRGRIEAWTGTLHLRLYHGADAAETLAHLSDSVGRPALPPAFAFAPWLDALYGSDNVRRVAHKLRDSGIPASVIWTEDWRGGAHADPDYILRENWRVDRTLYPDFEALASDLHGLGFKFLVYNNSFVVRGADIWDEALAGGYVLQTATGDPYLFMGASFVDTTLIDLSNPAARDWTKSVYTEGLDSGADGWMADYGEWLPTDFAPVSGDDPFALHNMYPVEFARLNREVLDAHGDPETLFFARAGYLGSQPLVSVYWAGDQQTDFSLGDGMPSVIPMGLGLGIAGFPYFAHDIGGYQSANTTPTTRELWYRWVELGALTPVMRTHHGRSAAADWNWESDDASTAHLQRWAELHMRLFPYLYALAGQAARTGMPMMRPAALRWPGWGPGWTMTDEYLLGDRILVAPVVEQGATSRRVKLPPGTFYPLLGGPATTMPAGGGETTVDAPLEECPVFVPAGTLLVLLPEGIDTAVAGGVTDAGVTTLAAAGDDRELWAWPGGASDWTEQGGTLSYAWSAVDPAAATGAATWNGTPVDATGGTITVHGSGTLAFAGGATLVVTGGAATRTIVVRVGG